MGRDDQRQAVKNIPLEQLKPFKNHPFQVRDDEEFRRLVESIGIYGVIHPAVARQIGENCYELISGHRRKAACEVLGYRASNNVNLQCKESIEAAVREHFDGMYLSHDAAKGVCYFFYSVVCKT